ncbi:MAG: acyl-CoA thioesterase [Thermoleophilia bacterium]|jgi:acyl-CoA hydrolase|nr:acyl-CoA thioesterase [Thermoleophilia bacterium]
MESRSVQIVFPEDTNHMGTLFGGTLMAWMDRAAYLAAARRAHGDVVTAAVERLEFRVAIHQGEWVELVARVEEVGRTSLRVLVEAFREDPVRGDRSLCTTGRFTMVALGADGQPREVGPAEPA